jgi:hypothetical protein
MGMSEINTRHVALLPLKFLGGIMGKIKKLSGEQMMVFVIHLREWWKTLTKTEQRLMRETVFRPVGKRRAL